jgi:hypothetical protein
MKEEKMASKILEGLSEAVAYARIDALWRRSKRKRGEEVTAYDWGYRDGVLAARSLFGTSHVVRVKKVKSGKHAQRSRADVRRGVNP